jgi:hypothetical protein
VEDQSHRPDVVAREAPVALSRQVAHAQAFGHAVLDPRDALCDLATHELNPTGDSWVNKIPAQAKNPKLSR